MNDNEAHPRDPNSPAPGVAFRTTSWNMVFQAGQPDSTQTRAALEKLCEIYWKPLFAFARVSGKSPEDAKDATQGFFEQLLEKNSVSQADATKGKFRTFLLSSFKHYLFSEWRKSKTEKRGGKMNIISADENWETGLLYNGVGHSKGPDFEFERRFAIALLERALQRLEGEYKSIGKLERFSAMKPLLTMEDEKLSGADLAANLGISENAGRAALHRLRREYLDYIRDEIRQTVGDAAEVDEELQHLWRVLGS